MRFTYIFAAFASVLAVNAVNSTVVDAIVTDLDNGNWVDAGIELLSVGDCDLSDLADCAATFADVIADCAGAALAEGKDAADDLKCFADVLKALAADGLTECISCAEEGIDIVETYLDSTSS